MSTRLRSKLLLLPLALLLAALFASPASAAGNEVLKVDTEDFPKVRVYVNWTTSEWKGGDAQVVFKDTPPEDLLKALDWFAAKKADPLAPPAPEKPSPTVKASASTWKDQNDPHEGRLVVLLVDGSASMTGAPLAEAKDDILAILSELRTNDRVAIFRVASQTEVLLKPETDLKKVATAVKNLDVSPNAEKSNIYEGLAATLQAFVGNLPEPVLPGRRFFFLFSDGFNNGTAIRTDDLQSTFKDPKILSYRPLVFSMCVGRMGDDRRCDELKRIANLGGDVTRFGMNSAPDTIKKAFAQASSDLSKQLLVEFDAPQWYQRKGTFDAVVRLKPQDGAAIEVPASLQVGKLPQRVEDDYATYKVRLDTIKADWLKTVRNKQILLYGGAGAGVLVLVVIGLYLSMSARRKRDAEAAARIEQLRLEMEAKEQRNTQDRAAMEGRLTKQRDEEARRAADAARRPLAVLFATDGSMKGQRFGLLAGRVVVGRDPARCDVVFPIEGGDPGISRVHAQFSLEPTGWSVTCLSDAGLSVRSTQVRKSEVYPVRTGDTILLGKTTFILQEP